jgi:hypothetical protein
VIPPGSPLAVSDAAKALDREFEAPYDAIGWEMSDLTKEAVEQLEEISDEQSESDLRARLATFATEREAIPAASYADRLVGRLRSEPPPFGRTFAVAVRNAWQDEALHTQFLLECVPRSSGEKRKAKKAAWIGKAKGTVIAYVTHHKDGAVFRRMNDLMKSFAMMLPGQPVNAIRKIEPMTPVEYFSATVEFEYAAALGWRVIANAELPKREISGGGGELNRVVWRAERLEPSDYGRVAKRIAETEVRHAKVFWQMSAITDHQKLIDAITDVHPAFVAPEHRTVRPLKQRFAPFILDATAGHARQIQRILDEARQTDGRGNRTRRMVIAVGDCSRRTAEIVGECFPDSPAWERSSIGAPKDLKIPAADDATEVFEFEAGCAKARWLAAWVHADYRISVADLSGGRRPGLTIGTLGRLVHVFPEQLRDPLPRTPDPKLYALMWLLEEFPPHFSIIFGDNAIFYVEHQGEPVAFDKAVASWEGLRRSPGLNEALRWFGPLVRESNGP